MIESGYTLEAVEEAMPSEDMVSIMPDEMRRPMMLLVRGRKIYVGNRSLMPVIRKIEKKG